MKRKKNIDKCQVINRRLKYLLIFILFIFLFIIYNLYNIIYVNKTVYLEKLASINSKIISLGSAPRGRILDRNGKVLVDNENKPIIIFKSEESLSINEQLELVDTVVNHIDLNTSKVTNQILKTYFYITNSSEIDKRITEEEYEKLKRRELNSNDIYNLKLSRITEEELNNMSDIEREEAYLYFLMNNGYSYDEKIIKDSDVTDEEFSYFFENTSALKGFQASFTTVRVYPYNDTFKSILGSVGKITKENKDWYLENGYNINDIVGTSYIEKQYESILKGEKATYKKINNNTLEKVSDAKKGSDIKLTIDIDLELKINEIIESELIKAKSEANTRLLNKTYVVIQEPNTGEVLAMSGRQIIKNNNSWDSLDITEGVITNSITPGSVVKGASMIVGYNTGAIDINTYMTDECIKIKSSPAKCSSHRVGRLNDITALAESSNVYQFKIAIKVGNGNYSYDNPLKLDDKAFDIYRNTFKEFGLGTLTEIDLPGESTGYIGTKKETNLLLNFAIGQYDTYTTMQLSQYITTIASNGNRIKPHLLKSIITDNKEENIESIILNKVETEEKYISRVQEGFRQVLVRGTGKNVMGNAPTPAGKTGTSESFTDTNNDGKIDTETVSNTFAGYAPFNNPEMTITVATPDVEETNTSTNFHSYVNRRIAREISNYYFDNYKN